MYIICYIFCEILSTYLIIHFHGIILWLCILRRIRRISNINLMTLVSVVLLSVACELAELLLIAICEGSQM